MIWRFITTKADLASTAIKWIGEIPAEEEPFYYFDSPDDNNLASTEIVDILPLTKIASHFGMRDKTVKNMRTGDSEPTDSWREAIKFLDKFN